MKHLEGLEDLVAEAGAVARHEDAGWPAVWSLVLVLALVAAAGLSGPVLAQTAPAPEAVQMIEPRPCRIM